VLEGRHGGLVARYQSFGGGEWAMFAVWVWLWVRVWFSMLSFASQWML